MQIELDDPFIRNKIREENREDPFLGVKYLEGLEIDEWLKELLKKFFPNIQGRWADHGDTFYVYILKTLRFSFECGFIDLEDCETFVPLLFKASNSLLKLEESCSDNFKILGKISDNFRAHSYTTHFANCRENIACILVQIITFYYDEYFLKNYPSYLSQGYSEEQAASKIDKDMKKGGIPFFNDEMND